MGLIISVLIVFIFIAGVQGDGIFLNYSRIITPCLSKTRSMKDIYRFTGVVEGNIPQFISERSPEFIAQVKTAGSSSFNTVCKFNLRTADTCLWSSILSNGICSCVYSPTYIYFTVDFILHVLDSLGHFRVKWFYKSGMLSDLNTNNVTLPEIIDVNQTVLTLTVGGNIAPLNTSNKCSFPITLDTTNPLLLCCSKTAMPCYAQISFLGKVVANNRSPCVTYAPTSNGMTGDLVLSHSVCAKDEYVTGNLCIARKGVVSTIATTATTGGQYPSTSNGGQDLLTSTDAGTTVSKAPPTGSPKKVNKSRLGVLKTVAIILSAVIFFLVVFMIIRRIRKRNAGANIQTGSLGATASADHHLRNVDDAIIDDDGQSVGKPSAVSQESQSYKESEVD